MQPLSPYKSARTQPLFLVNRRELQDAAPKASYATRLKDLVGSFNAKSALTIGDLYYSMFPEVAIHVSASYWT